jgi:cytochrome o ubiquinol oxidase subunit 1
MGVTRRMRVFDDPSLQIWFAIAAIGAGLIAVGVAAMLVQFAVSIWKREELREASGDSWEGRTLEWATTSPPPAYNFAFTPRIHALDAWYDMKAAGAQHPVTGYKDIHMPSNTGTGVILAGISTVCGFALVWHIWWLAGLSFAALIAAAIAHTFNYKRDFTIPAAEVAATEAWRQRQPVKVEA